jgi:hypothetical protein
MTRARTAGPGRAAPETAYRVYEIVAGMPGPTYLVFSSTASFADFDKAMASGMATMKAMNADEQAAMRKANESTIEAETQRFRLDPGMSYVSREVREQDPAFCMGKK